MVDRAAPKPGRLVRLCRCPGPKDRGAAVTHWQRDWAAFPFRRRARGVAIVLPVSSSERRSGPRRAPMIEFIPPEPCAFALLANAERFGTNAHRRPKDATACNPREQARTSTAPIGLYAST